MSTAGELEFDASVERETQTELEEHFPEPCAVGGHGRVWCAVCLQTWPCVLPPGGGRA